MTAIEWTDETWNSVTGCSHVSEGCRNCYAEKISLRHGWSKKPWTAQNAAENVKLHPERLDRPLHWREPRMIFVNSMSDLFHDLVPVTYIDEVFGVMAKAWWHTYQVLTKRPERMLDYLTRYAAGGRHIWNAAQKYEWPGWAMDAVNRDGDRGGWPLPQVWLGVSVEDQKTADKRIPFLLNTPAAVRFISAEPLLGPIDLIRLGPMDDGQGGQMAPDALAGGWWHRRGRAERWVRMEPGPHLDWVIAGGESQPKCRPMDLDWARSLRDQCAAAGVAFFLKQLGGFPNKRGKDEAVLDGRRWTEMPSRTVEV